MLINNMFIYIYIYIFYFILRMKYVLKHVHNFFFIKIYWYIYSNNYFINNNSKL